MSNLPKPVKEDQRINFGYYFFASEEDAMAWHEHLRNERVRSGFMEGMPGGRDKSMDHDGLFAVLIP